MERLLRDLHHGWRMLRKYPGFSTMAILTLALGIGANVAIFSFVDELWLRAMPVPHPDRLVRIFTSNPSNAGENALGLSSYPDFVDLRQNSTALSGVALLERRGALYDDGAQNTLITAAVVSDNFFDVLQPVAEAGRTFTENELKSHQALPVMLSFPFWRRQFGADASLVGRTIAVDRQNVTVTGILPRSFRGTEAGQVPNIWIPLTAWNQLVPGDAQRMGKRGFRDYSLFARLRDGSSLQLANLELANVAASLAKSFPDTNLKRQMTAVPETDTRGKETASFGLVLLGIAALVLLIACANVASLLLAHAEHRRKEFATRVALGATRAQIALQLLSETFLLTLFATAAALFVGHLVLGFLPALLPHTSVPRGVDAYLSARGFLCAIGAAMFSLFLFGVAPSWQASQVAPASALKGVEPSSGPLRYSFRGALVVLQVGLCLVMVVSAGLLVRSILKALDSNPGFSPRQNMIVMELVPGYGTRTSAESVALIREFRRRLQSLPGVTGTSMAMRFPFGMSGSGATRKVFLPEMLASNDREGLTINYDPVGDSFFRVLGTRILRGRPIEQNDLQNAARVIVVNQNMADRLWPHQDPLGKQLRLDKIDGEMYEVVGVAETGKYNDFQEDPIPLFYTPMHPGDYGELALAVRTVSDPAPMTQVVRRTLRDLNHEVAILAMLTWYDQVEEALTDQRIMARMIVALGGLGLMLATIGLYGLMSFLVARRTREIGIRMALGAEKLTILQLFLKSTFNLTVMGIVLGIVSSMFTTRLLRSLLFGVAPIDPAVFGVAIAILLTAAIVATLVPAIKAIRVDPMLALRNE